MTVGDRANPERAFGVSVGTVLVLVSAHAVWRGRLTAAAVSGGVGVVLVVLGQLRPSLLRRPSALWASFALALRYAYTRVFLTLTFVLVLLPLGLLRRVFGGDSLGWRRRTRPGWTPSPVRYRDRCHYSRMY
jgi:hypothetical protein